MSKLKTNYLTISSIIWGRKIRTRIYRGCVFILLCLLAIPFLMPFMWMLLTSLKPSQQILQFPPELLPHPIMWSNYSRSLNDVAPMGLYFLNTTYYSVTATFGAVFSSSLVAYGFAKFRALGRNLLLLLVISTVLIPYPVVMVPQFVLFQRLGWIDTYLPLIVPSFFGSAFLIFMLCQFFRNIPNDITDAARIDGAGPFRVYFQIILPLSKQGLITASILTFSTNWNDYLGPLLFINSREKFTIQLGLANFVAFRGVSHWELLMAASTVATLPVLTIFFIAQRTLIQGITVTRLR